MTAKVPAKQSQEESSWIQKEWKTAGILVAPAIAILLLVYAYPIGRSFVLSLFAENLGTQLQPVFNGLGNYGRLVGDGRFWQSLGNTTFFTVASVAIELGLGLAIALIGDGINWMRNHTMAMVSLIVADVWKTTPFVSVILLAGLQSISKDLYEAHAMDGATPWQSFTAITVPLLMPQILISVLFRFAQSFGIFDLVQVMTGGGPAGSTEMVSIYIYSTVMRYLDFGYGAALIVVTFLLLILAVALAAYALRRLGVNVTE